MCSAGLADVEKRLREGQLCSALDKLRLHLHIKSRLVRFKAQNVRHQAAITRAHEKIETNERKIIAAMQKYQAAWAVMNSYSAVGGWRELRREDVRCLQVENGTDIQSEGRRTVS